MSEGKDEWIPWKSNPVIEHNSKDKIFRCKEHPDFITKTSQGAGAHSTSHGYYLDGRKIDGKKGSKDAVESTETDGNEPEIQESEESDEEKSLEERIADIEGRQGEVQRRRDGAVDIVEQSAITTSQDIADCNKGSHKLKTSVHVLYNKKVSYFSDRYDF